MRVAFMGLGLLAEACTFVAIYFRGRGSLGLSRMLVDASAVLVREKHDPVSLAGR